MQHFDNFNLIDNIRNNFRNLIFKFIIKTKKLCYNNISENYFLPIMEKTMKRILRLQSALLKEIDKYENIVLIRDKFIDWERVHMASCARIGYLMAEERGVDPELASCACSVHDFGRIITGKQAGHAEAGYVPVKEFLKNTNLFNNNEIEEISLAVKNHSKKSEIGSPIEEIVKDADVLDFYQYGFGFEREEQRIRYEKIIKNKNIF